MSEETKELLPTGDDDQIIEVIPEGAIIEIKVSTGYYKRIQALLNSILVSKSKEEIEEAHTQIQTQNIKDEWVYGYETLLILCKEIESKAKEQDKLEKMTVKEAREAMMKGD